jgi:3-polyprenyl-4-hydroxybenzoate decarboxylase
MTNGGQPRLVVGMSGSSAPHLGVAFLRAARLLGTFETHFVLSPGARKSIELELGTSPADSGAAIRFPIPPAGSRSWDGNSRS